MQSGTGKNSITASSLKESRIKGAAMIKEYKDIKGQMTLEADVCVAHTSLKPYIDFFEGWLRDLAQTAARARREAAERAAAATGEW